MASTSSRRSFGRFGSESGFTLVELLFVLALASVLAAISASLFLDWRAQARFDEVVGLVERQITLVRDEGKRENLLFELTFQDGEDAIAVSGTDADGVEAVARTVDLPAGVTTTTDLVVSFDAVFGEVDPYAVASVGFSTGNGPLGREGTLSIIPPLGLLAVTR